MFSITLLELLINIIISIGCIYAGHLFWEYVKDNYGKKHTRDLVNSQIEKYKKICEELKENKSLGSQSSIIISDSERQNMDNDLTEFLQSQLQDIKDV
jgi:hypothetical protein